MTVDKLKQLFLEKYGEAMFLTKVVMILVTLTKDQYKELNDDLLKITGKGVLLMVDESDIGFMEPEDIAYTRIMIPFNDIKIKCEFFITLGTEFEFRMANSENEHGEGEL